MRPQSKEVGEGAGGGRGGGGEVVRDKEGGGRHRWEWPDLHRCVKQSREGPLLFFCRGVGRRGEEMAPGGRLLVGGEAQVGRGVF